MKRIIGRKREKKHLQDILESEEPAFLAVYGRRRVGKTYLIKNFFRETGLLFHLAGIQDASKEVQLKNFATEFSDHFRKGRQIETPKDWFEAFQLLRREMEALPKQLKKIIFLDELPWLATQPTPFLQALDHLWNRYLSDLPNVILVVCGSAASWMIDHVINAKGGLHNRVTKQIRLSPFTLAETEEFVIEKGLRFNRKQLIELYMCLGGVAKYLSYLEKGRSVPQSIGDLCFSYGAPLLGEFHRLYRSLFKHHEDHIAIVRALARKRIGLTYRQIAEEAGLTSGGTLSKRLEELSQCGFITSLPLFGGKKQDSCFVLTDEFSLFHLTWMSEVPASDIQAREPDYWIQQASSQSWKIWTGYAYEAICLKHLPAIKAALGLGAVQTQVSKWHVSADTDTGEEGAEIDLVLDRADQCMNLFEIKFYNDTFTLDSTGAEKLRKKRTRFASVTNTNKSIFVTLITALGARRNSHYLAEVDQDLTMDALF